MKLKSLALALLPPASPAPAQPAAVDHNDEAESALRRLKPTDQRRKIAAEPEMVVTRLKIAAGAGAIQR